MYCKRHVPNQWDLTCKMPIQLLYSGPLSERLRFLVALWNGRGDDLAPTLHPQAGEFTGRCPHCIHGPGHLANGAYCMVFQSGPLCLNDKCWYKAGLPATVCQEDTPSEACCASRPRGEQPHESRLPSTSVLSRQWCWRQVQSWRLLLLSSPPSRCLTVRLPS